MATVRPLPLGAGSLCLVILMVGLVGLSDSGSTEVPIPPYPTTGMMSEDLTFPSSFDMLSIEIEMKWTGETPWLGVVGPNVVAACPPDESGVTTCTVERMEELGFEAGGVESHGTLRWNPEPGSYRFVAGANLGDETPPDKIEVTYNWTARIHWFPGILLLGAGLALIFFSIIRFGDEEVEVSVER